jgi:hypothetical protein
VLFGPRLDAKSWQNVSLIKTYRKGELMKENWHELYEFPDYAISDQGSVANMKTGLPRMTSINQQGICKVSLYQENHLFTRSVAVLVANAFLSRSEDHFDTPVHLDGDRMNCAAENLMWRPRWFAIKYHKQFMLENFHLDHAHRVDIESGEHYYSLKEVCMKNGLYYYDVVKSCVEETFVPITYQEFRNVQE